MQNRGLVHCRLHFVAKSFQLPSFTFLPVNNSLGSLRFFCHGKFVFFFAFMLSLLLVIPCRMVKLYGDDVRNVKLLGSSRSYGPLDLSGDFTMLNAEIRNELHPHTYTHTHRGFSSPLHV